MSHANLVHKFKTNNLWFKSLDNHISGNKFALALCHYEKDVNKNFDYCKDNLKNVDYTFTFSEDGFHYSVDNARQKRVYFVNENIVFPIDYLERIKVYNAHTMEEFSPSMYQYILYKHDGLVFDIVFGSKFFVSFNFKINLNTGLIGSITCRLSGMIIFKFTTYEAISNFFAGNIVYSVTGRSDIPYIATLFNRKTGV